MRSASQFITKGGLAITSTTAMLDSVAALDPIFTKLDTKKGCILSSGFDYPGRHSRWEMGFFDPAIEFIAKKNDFSFHALNEQGRGVLALLQPSIEKHPHLASIQASKDGLSGIIEAAPEFIPEEQRSKQPSVFSIIRSMLDFFAHEDEDANLFGLYGAFGYDLIYQFEKITLQQKRNADFKDCHLYLPLELTVVDRKKEAATKITYDFDTPLGRVQSLGGGGREYSIRSGTGSAEISCDHAPGEFAAKVEKVIEGTKRGDYFEVVLSQSFTTRVDESASTIFRWLAEVNPSPYLFFVNLGEEQLIGSSPEIYVRVTGKRYETCPISGTIPRGETALEDAEQVKALMASEKDETELTMCSDVDRNDMARVCIPGSVKFLGRRQLEFYSHLIHTVDHLEGTLAEGFDCIDAFQTHMWACTVTGSPKPAAIQEIENLENSPRGWYSGAVGLISFRGDINTGIMLRTAVIKNGRATIRAGATLLHDSVPELEEQETRTKAAAFLASLTRGRDKKNGKHSAAAAQSMTSNKTILLVDCRDSFVHNLASYLREIGAKVITLRSGFPLAEIDHIKPDLVFLSPGPGTPDTFHLCPFIEQVLARNMAIFGVCLGHQAIGQYFGGSLKTLPTPVHGKASLIEHTQTGLFAELPQPLRVGRYHSLYIDYETVPTDLHIVAEVEDMFGEKKIRVPMAFQHRTLPIASVQFHPESLMTLHGKAGHQLLQNALQLLLFK